MGVDGIENSYINDIEDHEITLSPNLEYNVSSHEANVDKHHNTGPRIAMEFDSFEDVKEFYTSFAKKEGFGIRTRSTKEKFCMLVCSNEGQHTIKSGGEDECNTNMGKTKKKCSTSRTNCKASLVVSKAWKRHKWIITNFSNDHNHVMVSPKSVNYLRCHKKMSVAAKNLVEKFEEEGIPTGKVAAMFNSENSSFSVRDCWNHLRNFRRKNLDIGDALAVLIFCVKKQAENPIFFMQYNLRWNCY